MTVDEAGDHAAPPGVEALIGDRAGGLDRDHPVLAEDERGVADDAQRALAAVRIVRHEQADVVEDQGPHGTTSATAEASSRGTSRVT